MVYCAVKVLYKGDLNMNNEIMVINNMGYIQNRTNWCWAVACKILGEQYKMEDDAAQKASKIYPKGSNNPAMGGNSAYEQESSVNALAAQGVLWGSVLKIM